MVYIYHLRGILVACTYIAMTWEINFVVSLFTVGLEDGLRRAALFSIPTYIHINILHTYTCVYVCICMSNM